MDLNDFLAALHAMSDAQMRRVAATIETRSSLPADEVAWWRAHLTIDKAIRDSRCSRGASLAAVAASHAVIAVAEAADIMLPDLDVTCVARAAGDIARGYVAGAAAVDAIEYLVASWRSVLDLGPVTITGPVPSTAGAARRRLSAAFG